MNPEQISTIGMVICVPPLLLLALLMMGLKAVARTGRAAQIIRQDSGPDSPYYQESDSTGDIAQSSGIVGRSNWPVMTTRAEPLNRQPNPPPQQPRRQRVDSNGANCMHGGQTLIGRR